MGKKGLDLEVMAKALEASGRYRVLRRLEPRRFIEQPDGVETRLGLFLDVETTGLDPAKDEIIELAMVPFTYGVDGRIFEIHEAFERLRQPRTRIPAEIASLTGITDEMVAGQTIDPAEVTACVNSAALIVAHHAAFDRRFAERLSDIFKIKPWACSMTQIDWRAEGYEGTKLAYLAMAAGFFYTRHRAAQDCRAAIELLATRLPKTGARAMALLLDQARRPSWRVLAENSPYDLKDALKSRGYRWNGAENTNPRAWFIEVDDEALEQELAYLRTEIYRRDVEIPVQKITAYERFSDRA